MKKITIIICVCLAAMISKAQSWQNVGKPFGGSINALNSYSGQMFIGGSFKTYNSSPSNFLAFYDGTTITPFVNAAVTGTAINGLYVQTGVTSACYAMGTYTVGAGTTVPANCTKWSGLTLGDATWKVAGTAYTMAYGLPASNIPIQMVGGAFTSGGLSYVAKRNTANTAWQAAGSGFNGAVYALEYFGGTIYAGGDFTMSGTTAINHIAKWNIASNKWEPIATGNAGVNGKVRALKSYNGELYIGGDFTSANGVANKLLVKWTGTAFSKVGSADLTGASVRAIQVGNGAIVVGGVFTKVGTVTVKNAAYYKTAWAAMGSDLTTPVNSLIYFANGWYCGQEGATSTAATYLRKWNATVATEQAATLVAADFAAFPNPSSSELTIRADIAIKSIEVYNLAGSLVATYSDLREPQFTLPVTALPDGVYLTKVTLADGKIGCKKVVVAH
jgi:hypothetical protein